MELVSITWILNEDLSLFTLWHEGGGYPEIVTNADMGGGVQKLPFLWWRPFWMAPMVNGIVDFDHHVTTNRFFASRCLLAAFL